MPPVVTATITFLAVVMVVLAVAMWLRKRATFTTPAERAVHSTLATAGAAAQALRQGLHGDGIDDAAPYLRMLVGSHALALCDIEGNVVAWDGGAPSLRSTVELLAHEYVQTSRQQLVHRKDLPAHTPDAVRALVLQPMISDPPGSESHCVGLLAATVTEPITPGLLRTLTEVSRYAASQLELAELDASRGRLARAEVTALRAQISPHFIYNALNTIASFVRTDPARARELILEFADFTRYSFRSAGEFTTLADELQNIDRYLTLEQARFGDKLRVRLQIAPEVLNVVVPFLVLQPLVENAVRHGIAAKADGGALTITASDTGSDCVLSIEDDGIGIDPERLRSGAFDNDPVASHIGLSNVDERLRAVFGNEYGLVVETAVGAGTKVIVRVPKFRQGVRA
ncbi:histidine kinase [Hoyosella rhizosphaerae]|nr:histidine kinase [Hoyosella rhizosphaerae]MBN4928167.1 histidine kinase [Hoyosella rhizosphaerae]